MVNLLLTSGGALAIYGGALQTNEAGDQVALEACCCEPPPTTCPISCCSCFSDYDVTIPAGENCCIIDGKITVVSWESFTTRIHWNSGCTWLSDAVIDLPYHVDVYDNGSCETPLDLSDSYDSTDGAYTISLRCDNATNKWLLELDWTSLPCSSGTPEPAYKDLSACPSGTYTNSTGNISVIQTTPFGLACCLCDPWPPTEWPCWPCNGLDYGYSITLTVNYQRYSSDCVTPSEETGSKTYTNLPLTPNVPACGWTYNIPGNERIFTETGCELTSVVNVQLVDHQWTVMSGGSYCCGTRNYKVGNTPAGSYNASAVACSTDGSRGYYKTWTTGVVVGGAWSPTCAVDYECDTSVDNWSLFVYANCSVTTNFVDYCATCALPTARHIKFGSQEFWLDPAGLWIGWQYDKTWVEDGCSCAAVGFGYDLTYPVDITVSNGYCITDGWPLPFQPSPFQCTPPTLEVDEIIACP